MFFISSTLQLSRTENDTTVATEHRLSGLVARLPPGERETRGPVPAVPAQVILAA